MIRGMFVLLLEYLRVTAVRGLVRKSSETRLAPRLEGAGQNARRELAFGKGYSTLHAMSLFLLTGLGLTSV